MGAITKPKSLAQSRRDQVTDAVARRGRKTANIWVMTNPLTGEDIVVTGDLRMEHFYCCEGDPAVQQADYRPAPQELNGNEVTFDALVDFTDGHRECRHVRHTVADPSDSQATLSAGVARTAAERVGARYVVVTAADLDAQQQRILNWGRALGALARCGNRPLELVEFEVLANIPPGKPLTLGALCEALTEDPALLIGATVRLVRKRALVSDLDRATFSRHTRVWRQAVA